MAYRVYGRVISNGLSGNLRLNERYKIDIYEETGIFKVPSFKDTFSLNNLKVYFKIYLNKKELLELIKNNLSITDDDIIEFTEYLNVNVICVKYKHDLIYLKLQNLYDGIIKTTMGVEIKSNNLDRQKTFEIELFEDDINKFCDLLKLMHK